MATPTTDPGRPAPAPGRPRWPDFVVLGAAKAGTTSLARWLSDRPEVFLAAQKELDFFSYPNVWGRGPAWYRAQFAAAGDRLAGEASPSYLGCEPAPARMAAAVPDARLVALLRDPVERAVSHYLWRRNWGAERRPLPLALEQEISGVDVVGYLHDGRYVRHLRRYAEHFPREALLVLSFESLRDRPEQAFAAACRHLGLAPRPVPASVGTAYNPTSRVRPVWLWKALGRWRGRRREWSSLPSGVDRLLARPQRHPPLEPGLRRRLEEYYAEDDAALAQWLGTAADGFGWLRRR